MNKKARSNLWDILAWIALAIILIWVLLKSLGIINTPLWLEYAPIWPAIYLAGWGIERLKRTNEDLTQIKKSIINLGKDMNKIRYSNTCPVFKEKD